jgi:hypothetical protein
MEVGCQLHAPAGLPPVPIAQDAVSVIKENLVTRDFENLGQ